MAGEVTVTASISVSKIPPMVAAVGRNIANAPFNLSSGVYSQGVISVTTSEILIPMAAVTTPGFCVLYNSDTVNYVEFYTGSGGTAFLRLNPGNWNLLNLSPSLVLYGKAHTSACLVEYLIFNG